VFLFSYDQRSCTYHTNSGLLILSGIIELILELQLQAAEEKSQLQHFLGQVTEQLQDLDSSLGSEVEDQKAFMVEGDKLNDSINEQVNGIQLSVDEATDIVDLKESISSRLDHIRSHMDGYKEFGKGRAGKAEERIQEMNRKIKSLEDETKDLKDKIVKEHEQALTDALTSVPNRMAYNEQIKQEYARWKRYKEPLSIIMWDIDFFKRLFRKICG
jgi:diguanylate cyclase